MLPTSSPGTSLLDAKSPMQCANKFLRQSEYGGHCRSCEQGLVSAHLARASGKPEGYMRRFQGRRSILFAFLACLAVPISSATDHKLLSLVPPDAQIVARISAPTSAGNTGNFVVITHNNGVDLSDFFALSGADGNRSIHELIFVAAANTVGQLSEHSLLASGNFDRERIYRSAVDNGSATTRYLGVSVLVVAPFARERG